MFSLCTIDHLVITFCLIILESDNYCYFLDTSVLNVFDSDVISNFFFIHFFQVNGVINNYNSILHLDLSSILKLFVYKSRF